MIRYILLTLSIILPIQLLANMANPVWEGTLGSRPFVSEFVDVVHEDLYIKIDENFEQAFINVKYHIRSAKDGFQIPFLFYASEYVDGFTVTLDGQEVEIKDIPYDFAIPDSSSFQDFSAFYGKSSYEETETLAFPSSNELGFYVNIHDMLYFETSIPKGEHVIEVNYKARRWVDNWDWVKAYSYRYALSPAKYWKSFGTLNITVDASDFEEVLITNLGQPVSGDIKGIANWKFDALPIDIFQINYDPKISGIAQSLIEIGPEILALLLGVALALGHWWWVVRYRRRHVAKRFSFVVLLGSVLVPIACVICYLYCFDFIDYLIGDHASRRHGYTFLIVAILPFVIPVYWLVFWLLDRRVKRKLSRRA